jgi:hypothetical protein
MRIQRTFLAAAAETRVRLSSLAARMVEVSKSLYAFTSGVLRRSGLWWLLAFATVERASSRPSVLGDAGRDQLNVRERVGERSERLCVRALTGREASVEDVGRRGRGCRKLSYPIRASNACTLWRTQTPPCAAAGLQSEAVKDSSTR